MSGNDPANLGGPPSPTSRTRSDGVWQVYVYDAFGKLAAEYATVAPASPCRTCYFSSDHLGSVRLVTDQNGNVVSRHDYLPFGEEIWGGEAGRNSQFGAADNTRQRFTGQMRDGETTPNLDYFEARYYSGEQGRFLSPDPGNAGADLYHPQSWNGYAYVLGNPLALTDPSGMISGSPCENNTACMSHIPGCLENVQLCTSTFFGTDPVQGVPDPFALLSIPVKVFSYVEGTAPQATYLTFPSGTTSATITFGTPPSGSWQWVPSNDDVPLNDFAQGVFTQLGKAAPAQQAFLGKFMLGSTAAGAGAGTGTVPTLSEAGTIIRTGTAIGATQVGQLSNYLFAQSDNKTVAQGVLNNNNYFRIGMGFYKGVVFRISIGSKHAPLPSWIPGVVNGTLHFNLWRF